MKISIVVPAYNEETLIKACLESIKESAAAANLSLAEYEIILVNNASTDRTKEIALSVDGVKVVDEARKGITRAKQAGFLAATGDIVAHPDADTMMPKKWIKQTLAAFESDSKLIAISGPYDYYDASTYARAVVQFCYGVGFAAHVVISKILHAGAMIQGGNYAVRRNALEKIGGYDTSIEFYGEDFDIARRLSGIGEVRWMWSLKMLSSGRRLMEEGPLLTGIRYGINNMAATFLHRPLMSEYKDIRPTK